MVRGDLTPAGAYFVTIRTRERECLFGHIADGEMQMNGIGQIVRDAWNGLPDHYPHIELDAFTVMPNHVHGIVIIAHHKKRKITLGQIIAYFKYKATKQINEWRNTPAMPVWQGNYDEDVIRSKNKLSRTRKHITNNPARWADDEDNSIHYDVVTHDDA
jgi:putative transposase